jgi:hypothetical protein
MWVKMKGKVGIYTTSKYTNESGAEFTAQEFHQTDDKGNTKLVVTLSDADLSALTQASLADIPELRRPAKVEGAAAGYV